MVSAFALYMYCIDAHSWAIQAHVHTHKDTKRSLPPPKQWEARKEETPNMLLGYKLGAVSITMYINSHTSF